MFIYRKHFFSQIKYDDGGLRDNSTQIEELVLHGNSWTNSRFITLDRHFPLTWGLAISWLDVVIFGCSLLSAAVSAEGNLLGSISKLRLLVIILALVLGGQLVNSPTAQCLERCALCLSTFRFFLQLTSMGKSYGHK